MPEIGGKIPLSLSSQKSSPGILNRPPKRQGALREQRYTAKPNLHLPGAGSLLRRSISFVTPTLVFLLLWLPVNSNEYHKELGTLATRKPLALCLQTPKTSSALEHQSKSIHVESECTGLPAIDATGVRKKDLQMCVITRLKGTTTKKTI